MTHLLTLIQHTPVSRIALVAGYGIGSKANFGRLQTLAERWGCDLGCTRPVVTAGYADASLLVGQTGRTISPDLYIALGVSGHAQHLCGVQAQTIVAVNTDPDAPIHRVAHHVICSDVADVLARLETVELGNSGNQEIPKSGNPEIQNSLTVVLSLIRSRAASVDSEGSHLVDGHVVYAQGIQQDLRDILDAHLYACAIPTTYGGLGMTALQTAQLGEQIAAADPAFFNIWSLASCAAIIAEYGTDEQRQRYLPRIADGATMSMDLTEPNAGSDLQHVMLAATPVDPEHPEGTWLLNGVKRFITNGDSDLHLVLARSEPGTTDGRGLSLFIYDRRASINKDGRASGLTIRHLEDKMGLHGSPTCELLYHDAPAQLIGTRRMGLLRYVLPLMNRARLGVATQSVGIQQAVCDAAREYAAQREQYGQSIEHIPAVADMLSLMQARLQASRALLYETAHCVDEVATYQTLQRQRTLTPDERTVLKAMQRRADQLTPLAKGMTSEFANQSAYDAVQVFGGTGYMRGTTVERLYRAARVLSIYEGTTQLQVTASGYPTRAQFEMAALAEMDRLLSATPTADPDTVAVFHRYAQALMAYHQIMDTQ